MATAQPAKKASASIFSSLSPGLVYKFVFFHSLSCMTTTFRADILGILETKWLTKQSALVALGAFLNAISIFVLSEFNLDQHRLTLALRNRKVRGLQHANVLFRVIIAAPKNLELFKPIPEEPRGNEEDASQAESI